MKHRHLALSLLAVAAVACTSTSLHPKKPYGAYAVVVAPSALPQAQPLINELTGRFEKLDVLTDVRNNQSSYRAMIFMVPAADGAFSYEVLRQDYPPQKGVVTMAKLDQLVDDAGGRRGLTYMDHQRSAVPHVAPVTPHN